MLPLNSLSSLTSFISDGFKLRLLYNRGNILDFNNSCDSCELTLLNLSFHLKPLILILRE